MSMLTVVLLVIAAAIVTVVLLRRRPGTERAAPSEDAWMNRARSLVTAGRTLVAEMSPVATPSAARDVPDDRLRDLGARIGEFSRSVAPVSACAPTVMDARVCRSVALRAHALGGAFERELRRREILDSADPGDGRAEADLQPLLTEFNEAIADLDTHLELL